MKNKTNIIICGDICPTSDTKHFFDNNDISGLFNDTLPILENADVLMGNMEFALTDNCKPAIKTGPILHGQSTYINLFKSVGFDVLGLANNHIKDCGEKAVIETIKTCHNNNILTVGAGKNNTEAKKPIIIEKNGWKIGVMAFAEHEFNAAYKDEAGANLLDVYDDFDRIKEFKKQVDYLIILNHGGIEYYEYPSPLLQKKCRKMIDSGADYVVNQHSHIIGTEEDYKQGKILYGQGNTIFGYKKDSDSWNQGLLVNLLLEERTIKINYIPIKITKKNGISLQKTEERIKLQKILNNRKKQITSDSFINSKWKNYCKTKESFYFPLLLGKNKTFNRLNRLTNNKLIRLFYKTRRFRVIKNLIQCESHNEVITTLLNKNDK